MRSAAAERQGVLRRWSVRAGQVLATVDGGELAIDDVCHNPWLATISRRWLTTAASQVNSTQSASTRRRDAAPQVGNTKARNMRAPLLLGPVFGCRLQNMLAPGMENRRRVVIAGRVGWQGCEW